MINFDASTPQLNFVKEWLESYITLDTKNTEPFLSQNYRHEMFPKSSDAPDQTKKAHVEAWGTILSSMNKLEVGSIQQVPENPTSGSETDIHRLQLTAHEVVEAPGKVVVHVRPSLQNFRAFQTVTRDHCAGHICISDRRQEHHRF
jgi:hypothetical protein